MQRNNSTQVHQTPFMKRHCTGTCVANQRKPAVTHAPFMERHCTGACAAKQVQRKPAVTQTPFVKRHGTGACVCHHLPQHRYPSLIFMRSPKNPYPIKLAMCRVVLPLETVPANNR